jgi:hypothetical protein
VIQCPTAPDGKYVFFTFDSLQNPMDADMRTLFALVLSEVDSAEVVPKCELYEPLDVENFLSTRMMFVHVKVCNKS